MKPAYMSRADVIVLMTAHAVDPSLIDHPDCAARVVTLAVRIADELCHRGIIADDFEHPAVEVASTLHDSDDFDVFIGGTELEGVETVVEVFIDDEKDPTTTAAVVLPSVSASQAELPFADTQRFGDIDTIPPVAS